MTRINNKQLVDCIEKCFDLSMDGRLTQPRRSEMLALGKRLRGSLINLLSAEFADDLKAVKDANQKLQAVNQTLTDSIAAINKIADTVKEVTRLVTSLDKLLKLVVSFK